MAIYVSFRPCSEVTVLARKRLEDVCEGVIGNCKGLTVRNKIRGLQVIVNGGPHETFVPVVGVFVRDEAPDLRALTTIVRAHCNTHRGAVLKIENEATEVLNKLPWGEKFLQLVTQASRVNVTA